MRKLTLAAFGAVALLASLPASADVLRGDAFITAMNGNTLSGKMADGTPYKLYFVPGGQATIQEGKAEPQFGTWTIDKSGDVCLKWPEAVASEDGCYRVHVDGTKVTWSNKDGTNKGKLLGGVAPLEMSKAD
jgi:hypothetical protein